MLLLLLPGGIAQNERQEHAKNINMLHVKREEFALLHLNLP